MTYPHQQYLAERPDGHTLEGIPGDCYRTCVGILLDTDPTTLPHFVMHGANWWNVTRRTVLAVTDGRYDMGCYNPSPWPVWSDTKDLAFPQLLVIATGPSPRGPFPHCVVIDSVTGDLVHDPHPSGAGLAGPIDLIDALATVALAGWKARAMNVTEDRMLELLAPQAEQMVQSIARTAATS